MVDVICDTSFLIHLATKRIKNLSQLDTEIGQIQFVVPTVVINELNQLLSNETKKNNASITLRYIKKFRIIPLDGKFADKEMILYVKNNGGIIATMDKDLKNKIKENKGSVISFSNDRIVLEN
ncbi:MAG: twitching motility protein PilT [Crenarchaeota archaeon]|nr:MAG: twitching motility protein PilT [Thermoproteota archaeon]RDJ33394.1 MAG: twitching motility protein PilT [Thermoproteota archaeon]RDJ36101.1 MAG: twitching motility protein PilT [Thermoproteota archaeon]RDJ38734.1 MAG: twitching motility protein PilT [Thermoproteota archaeon]